MREIDAGDDLTLIEYTNEEIESMKPDLDELRVEISATAEHDASCPNLRVILHYRERNSIYNQRVTEFEIVNKGWKEKRELRNSLARRRTNEFNAGFESISEKVKQMYQMITLGGDAELELVNSLAPFEDGVVFTVRPPKKSWKNIWNLSGGEKTLASLSLVFALHIYKPTPLYVMDEIDAALGKFHPVRVGYIAREDLRTIICCGNCSEIIFFRYQKCFDCGSLPSRTNQKCPIHYYITSKSNVFISFKVNWSL